MITALDARSECKSNLLVFVSVSDGFNVVRAPRGKNDQCSLKSHVGHGNNETLKMNSSHQLYQRSFIFSEPHSEFCNSTDGRVGFRYNKGAFKATSSGISARALQPLLCSDVVLQENPDAVSWNVGKDEGVSCIGFTLFNGLRPNSVNAYAEKFLCILG